MGASLWGASPLREYRLELIVSKDNHEHKHSGIRYVSPAQRHDGRDHALLAARHALNLQARERHRRRWSGATRNWTPIAAVTLNPEREAAVNTGAEVVDKQPLAA